MKKKDNFSVKLGLGLRLAIMTKEESALTKIILVFAREEMLQQHKGLKYYIDLYFPYYQLAIEVDEKGHKDRDEYKEEKREN